MNIFYFNREKVFETIKNVENEQGLVNVNLFLHALGIDASQIELESSA